MYRVLDVGCGTGDVSLVLAGYGHQVTGIDASSASLKYAIDRSMELGLKNAVFLLADAEQPFADDERYDVIVCSEVLEHNRRPEKVLANMCRLLSESGIAIITVPNGYGPYELSKRIERALMTTFGSVFKHADIDRLNKLDHGKHVYEGGICDVKSSHVVFFTLSKLGNLFDAAGFRVVQIGSSDFLAGMFPLSIVSGRMPRLCRFDYYLADILPRCYCSGWYFTLKRK